jgi:hypothetical protein
MRCRVLVCLVALGAVGAVGAGCDGTLRFAESSDASAADADAAPSTCPDACDGGLVCAPALQQCVVPCAEEDEHVCPASAPTCNEQKHYCVSCTSDVECAAITDDGTICDTTTGQCVHCLSDADCSDLQPRCDPSSSKCVECLRSSDCPDEDTCDPTELTCD